ncbi:hypothetical protein PMAYCL1PPCAC_08955 [Pristionchus mayeri]|uniref:C2H2-type domain-containing protein n=1 Tax=Pristionchus mayeri TaxID=1317129 RepID=A0AAN4ZDE8_9BILA|nr:hypothetical protein PMAYCL1PPCAC_08955 [Pristionchus mayeri]
MFRVRILDFNDPRKKIFECDVCGKFVNDSSALRRHKMIHDHKYDPRKRPFTCDICRKKFGLVENMQKHKKGHSPKDDPNRKFECEICGKMIASGF